MTVRHDGPDGSTIDGEPTVALRGRDQSHQLDRSHQPDPTGAAIATLLEFRASVDRCLLYVGAHRNPDPLTRGAGYREASARQEHDREWVRRPVIAQPRERAVACRECGTETWNVDAVCNRCSAATTTYVAEPYVAEPVDCPKCPGGAS